MLTQERNGLMRFPYTPWSTTQNNRSVRNEHCSTTHFDVAWCKLFLFDTETAIGFAYQYVHWCPADPVVVCDPSTTLCQLNNSSLVQLDFLKENLASVTHCSLSCTPSGHFKICKYYICKEFLFFDECRGEVYTTLRQIEWCYSASLNGFIILSLFLLGWWFIHCHIDLHADVGQGVVLKVGELEDMEAVPDDYPKCGDYRGNK